VTHRVRAKREIGSGDLELSSLLDRNRPSPPHCKGGRIRGRPFGLRAVWPIANHRLSSPGPST